MLVPDLLNFGVSRMPNAPAVRHGTRVRSFAELDDAADRASTALKQLGLQPEDRVSVLAQNELEYVELHLACDRAGLVFQPLNPRLTVAELSYIVGNAAPRLLISGPGLEDAAAQLDVEYKWHLGADGPGDNYDRLRARTDRHRFQRHRPASDASAIMYTSGTTGRPKGAVISRGAIWARCVGTFYENDARPGDVFVQGLPMFHIAAHNAYSLLARGGCVVLPEGGFEAEKFCDLMQQVQATHALVVPTMINWMTADGALGRRALPGLRMVTYGASTIASDVLERALSQTNAGFLQMYGMTETYGTALLRPADHVPGSPLLASAGTDMVNMQTRVVGEDGLDRPPGETGEVWSRGPTLMTGYWQNEEATQDSMIDGWMRTGDVGHMDENGYLFIADRLSEMIISGGENIYPREVEDVLMAHPDIFEVAVIGVRDDRWGQRAHALVVPHDRDRIDLNAVEASLRQQLAGYKVPKSWELVDDLPKNATGKIMKKELRARYN